MVAGGGDIFQLFGQDIEVRMNWSDGWKSAPETKPSIDFVKSFGPEGLAVPTGAEPIYIDFAGGAFIEASIKNATLMLSQFVYVQGDFAFRKGGSREVTVEYGIFGTIKGVRTNTIEFGASNVQAFIGVGGPYIQDSNRDGYVTDHDVIEGGVLYKADPINTSAIGIW